MKLNLLRFVYRGILTGMPLVAYNPITKTTLHVPFTIRPQSTYVNYKLSSSETSYLNEYIQKYDKNMEITPVKLLNDETESHDYLSVNIYNCSSPIFFNDNKDITRLEINTYIRKWNETLKKYNYGTLILDYTSNELSMDPIHIFKDKEELDFLPSSIDCMSVKDEIDFHIKFIPCINHKQRQKTEIHEDLIIYSDAIYYKNGIYDKLYYDSSLVKSCVHQPFISQHSNFYYKGIIFDKPQSVFYFENPIFFVGGMWDNVFSLLP